MPQGRGRGGRGFAFAAQCAARPLWLKPLGAGQAALLKLAAGRFGPRAWSTIVGRRAASRPGGLSTRRPCSSIEGRGQARAIVQGDKRTVGTAAPINAGDPSGVWLLVSTSAASTCTQSTFLRRSAPQGVCRPLLRCCALPWGQVSTLPTPLYIAGTKIPSWTYVNNLTAAVHVPFPFQSLAGTFVQRCA